MIINRVWAMPNSETFKIKPIKDLINKYMVEGIWADPFVRNSIFKDKCQFTNDLDSSIQATSNLESLDFLNSIETNTIDGVLFDPPYSPRQISECYKGVGLKVNKTDTDSSWYSERKIEIARILKKSGISISFGWNSNGIGKTRRFEIIEILIVAHGGNHNDTIVTVERKL